MDAVYLTAPKSPPDLDIPDSTSTVDVRVIDTYVVHRYLQSPV